MNMLISIISTFHEHTGIYDTLNTFSEHIIYHIYICFCFFFMYDKISIRVKRVFDANLLDRRLKYPIHLSLYVLQYPIQEIRMLHIR